MLAPASGSRGSSSSAPARVPAPIPPRPLPERSPAQPSPARIRFRTLTAVAKDRRTPHHRLKIRPPSRAETQDTGSALPGLGGGVGLRRRVESGPGSSGSGCTAPRRRRGCGRGRQDRGAGREHVGARGSRERTCVEVRRGPGHKMELGATGMIFSGGPFRVAARLQSPGANSP